MSNAQIISETCTHERRPGTSVCLHCRHAAKVAARAKRKRLFLRVSAVATVLAVVGGVGVLSAGAFRRGKDAARGIPAARIVVASASTPATPAVGDSAASPSRVVQQGAVAAHASAPARAPLTPVLRQGQTALPDGVTAARTDSTVTLSFDTPELRTRMPDKFERFVRRSLPEIYGPAADSLLAKIPSGALASQGNLLSELPVRGLKVPIDDAWMIALYPETRPGQDGLLVVRYRVSVVARN